MRNTALTIDQNALAHNLSVIRSTLNQKNPAKVLAMVKANAYGHGVSYALAGLKHADAFGVACMSEALEVKKTCQTIGISKPIVLIEGTFDTVEWLTAIAQGFGVVIHNERQLQDALTYIPKSNSFTHTVWLKYNTGMNRLGFNRQNAITAAKLLHNKGYKLILTSHFACADEENSPVTIHQINHFNELLKELHDTISLDIQGSLCNSAGIFKHPNQHHDWVRAGIALYGSSPFVHTHAHTLNLKPAMIFSAYVMAIQYVKTTDAVSYGSLWRAPRSSRIGIISCGYGDGYPRVVHQAFVGVIDGNSTLRVPIVGRVAMDMMMVDLTDTTADVGTKIILWGQDTAPSIDEVASYSGTIGYELMCRTTIRPIRQVITKSLLDGST